MLHFCYNYVTISAQLKYGLNLYLLKDNKPCGILLIETNAIIMQMRAYTRSICVMALF